MRTETGGSIYSQQIASPAFLSKVAIMSIGLEAYNEQSRNIPAVRRADASALERVSDNVEFGVLMCLCPTTHRLVESGIEMDQQTFQKIGHLSVHMRCRACGNAHVLIVASGPLKPLGSVSHPE